MAARSLFRRVFRSNPSTRRAVRPATAQKLMEALERRQYLAVTASFNSGTGLLSIVGDNLDNTITVSRNAAGSILINNGAVAVSGGIPTVANTAQINVSASDGNDLVEFNESNGALPRAHVFGGAGNDTLIGGSGNDTLSGDLGDDLIQGRGGNDSLLGGDNNDVLIGGDGDDVVFGNAGNDRFIWNPGDDTDLNEGGDGIDTVEINGGNGAEVFTTTANGTRVRFDRLDPAPFAIDIGTCENLVVNMNGGNDSFSATGNLAALISITVDGGTGNDTILGSNGADTLIGGDDDDFIDGQQGNDVVFMGAGNDTFQWDPGDGSDIVEGGTGTDTMRFSGSATNEIFDVSPNGGRARFTRNVANVVMDLDDIEKIELNMLGGADTVTVNNLAGTDLTEVNVALAGTLGGTTGDAAADTVIVNGTSGNDVIDVFGSGTSYSVVGLPTRVNVTTSEGANDSLVVNALGGHDGVTATTLPAGVVKLTMDGGAGNDTLLGSQGADVLLGGDNNDFIFGDNGNDLALMGAGDDVFQWDPGDGNDTIEGQAGNDTMRFFGSNASENINVLANGGRVLFTRDVANVTMDLDDVENIDFRALGGADNIVVGDLSGTDLTRVDLDLRGPTGGGDGSADTVTVNGTNADDVFGALGDAGGVSAFGLQAAVNIFFQEQANDRLILNALGGDDTVDATSLEADGIQLVINGGLGNDVLIGGKGNDTINGGDGNDLALMGAGDDTFVWNPGDDNDVIEGQAGNDTMLFNGSNVAENITLAPNAGRVIFFRDVASVTMDLNDVEAVDFNALGGADTIVVNDMSGTDLKNVNLNLAASGGAGDAQPDIVVVNGTSTDDIILPKLEGANFIVEGLPARVTVSGFESVNDRVNIHALAGDDIVDASEVGTGGPQLTLDGGADNDTLVGGAGADVLLGGAGDDVLLGNGGIDLLDGGAGSNIALQGGHEVSAGIVSLFGSNANNTFNISRNAAGQLFSNGAAITGATIANTAMIRVFGMAGHDNLVLDQTNGALPMAVLYGGAGNDTMSGGSGGDYLFGGAGSDVLSGLGGVDFLFGGADNDTLTGGDGDDHAFGESGNDRFIWNPGDDTDLNEGGLDLDTVEVNGGGGAESFTTTANGTRVRFDRLDPAPFSIDIGTSENLVVNMNGGNDSFSATGNLAALISIAVDGGDGNDTLLGSNGADTLMGGNGDDFLDGQQGNDLLFGGAHSDVFQWDPGDGSDVIEGGGGADSLLFNGSNAAEIFDISSNAGRLRFARNIGNVVLDADDISYILLNTFGGADQVVINNLAGTDVTEVSLNLGASGGGGDAQADSVVVNGSANADNISVVNMGANRVGVLGLQAAVEIQNAEPTLDTLTVLPRGGADTVTVSDGLSLSSLTIGVGGDNVQDLVTLNANANGNNIGVVDVDGATHVTGLSTNVFVSMADPNDALRINTLGGFDIITVDQVGTIGSVLDVLIDAGNDGDSINIVNTSPAGTVTILPSAGNDSVTVGVNSLIGAKAIFGATQRIGALNIGAKGNATVAAEGAEKVLTVSSLSINAAGKLDLTDNTVIVDHLGSTPAATFLPRLVSGYANGAWNGNGIISSTAAANGTHGVGFADSTELFSVFPATFRGQSIDNTAVLLSYARYGDTNLDGTVNLVDFNELAANFGQSNRRWRHGDFDYNGTTNLADFNVLASNFGAATAISAGASGIDADDPSTEDPRALVDLV